ncbi:MAG: hypothetical protein JW709_04580 [Sedimentisphaerales bacterium]|nr:hypothetical protein [Sedimentisphaerales bacterium]
MKLVLLTNDNFFSFTVLNRFLEKHKNDIKLVIFSSALIGKRGTLASIKWSLKNTGWRHTIFKLTVYGVFRFLRLVCTLLPFLKNHYSSFLWVKRNNIPYIISPNINTPEVLKAIQKAKPNLIISVSMNQIVKKDILELPPQRCINVHCAPLPRYGGMSPYIWALANNEDHSAATIHYMDEGLDTGDILVQEKIPVVKKDSAFALFYRCCRRAGELLEKVVTDIETNQQKPYSQDLSQKTYFSWPTTESIRNLRKNGYHLATFVDFILAIFSQKPRC